MPGMHNIGDLRNLLSQFLTELRKVKYNGHIDHRSLCAGIASVYLPFLHFILLECYPEVTQYLCEHGYDLRGKKDRRFVDGLYKLLRDEFQYKPVLSKDQFFHLGFAGRKLAFLTDVFRLIQQWQPSLKPVVSSITSPSLAPEPRSPPTKTAYLSDPEEPLLSSTSTHSPPPPWSQALAYIQSSIATLESTLEVVGSRLSVLEKEQEGWVQKYQRLLSEKETCQHECEILRNELHRYRSSTLLSRPMTTASPDSVPLISQPTSPHTTSPLRSSHISSFPRPLPLSTSLNSTNPSLDQKIQQANHFRSRIQERLQKTQGLLSKTTKYMGDASLTISSVATHDMG